MRFPAICYHLPLTLNKGYHLCQYLLTLSQPELIIKDLLFQIYTLIFLPFTFLKSSWWQYGDKGWFLVTGRALELENGLPQILTYLLKGGPVSGIEFSNSWVSDIDFFLFWISDFWQASIENWNPVSDIDFFSTKYRKFEVNIEYRIFKIADIGYRKIPLQGPYLSSTALDIDKVCPGSR